MIMSEELQKNEGFIGEREIAFFTAEADGSIVNVVFKEGEPAKLSGTLFFHLKTDEKGSGSLTDNINHYFAKKFLAELAEEGMEYYFVENVGTAMRILAHNLREDAIRKAFECSGGDAIPLIKLIP